jgi:hypothetical protein
MRMFIAALLSAAAVLPALGHATTALPDAPKEVPRPGGSALGARPAGSPLGGLADPTDAAASVPALSVPSAFADYQPYRDQKAPTWQELNRAVTSSSGMAGMSHGKMPAGGTGAKNNEHSSKHEEPAK